VIETDGATRADWSTPGVYRCAPGVYRIPLPLPTDALRAVNVYALADDEGGLVLVDSGWALAAARDRLDAALAELGAGLGDVQRFLVTHAHRDHYTLGVELRREFGTKIALGRGEQPALEYLNRPDRLPLAAQRDRLLRAGAADVLERIMALAPASPPSSAWDMPDAWLDDGELLEAGTRKLRALATPGHTRGHVVFHDADNDVLFAGDHVLPHITPSIGFEPVPPALPLAEFLTSLQLVRELPDAQLLPAHGPITDSVHKRVDELISHHDARLAACLAALATTGDTAAEVAAVLPWTRRNRTLAELDPLNQMLAVLETAAHLELLAARGVLTLTEQDGVTHFRA
jgi:glyoxylase-like metal-dependent hydrolase (beta-lactamase superfamily II)